MTKLKQVNYNLTRKYLKKKIKNKFLKIKNILTEINQNKNHMIQINAIDILNTAIYLNFVIHKNIFQVNRDFKIIQHKTLIFTQRKHNILIVIID